MQKRFRKTTGGTSAEVWVELGMRRYAAELYENGEFVVRRRGPLPKHDDTEELLTGPTFAALVRIQPDRIVRCTWAR